MSFILTNSAEAQLNEILDYVARDSVAAALKVHDALMSSAGHLAEMPEIGHTREDLTPRPLKFWSVFSYLIVYDPASRPLTIVAILHGARDIENILGAASGEKDAGD